MTFGELISKLVGKTVSVVKMPEGEGLTITFTDGSEVEVAAERHDSYLTFNGEEIVYPHKPSNYDSSIHRPPA